MKRGSLVALFIGLMSLIWLLTAAMGNLQGLEKVKTFLQSKASCYTISSGQGVFLHALDRRTRPSQSFKQKLTLRKSSDLRPRAIDFYAYYYSDTAECKQAFDSLLKCFPTDCFALIRPKRYESYKIVPSIVIRDGQTIIAASTSCSDTIGWDRFKADVKDALASPHSETIEAACGGPLWWSHL